MSRAIVVAGFSCVLAGCGSRMSTFDEGGVDAAADGGVADLDASISPGDGGFSDAKGCTNLQCKVDLACGDAGNSETTITGTVYDPAGTLGLYGIYVYIPNAAPDPIAVGNPTCDACQAPASGSPIIGGLTDSHGHFTISRGPSDTWGVPSGDNIPLVIQAGKWRRQLVIPHVDDCSTLDLDAIFNSGTGSPQQQHQMRLPSKSSEGDMPLIAFTSGYDPAECFLLHIGIDPSEFVPPGSMTGHVQFFTGKSSINNHGSQIAGGNTPLQTYQWWSDSQNLEQYDIVFNACEGSPNDRKPQLGGVENPYVAMDKYLKHGGRLFATHYYENWFTNSVTPDLETAAQWASQWGGNGGPGIFEADVVDQTFPKGQAFADWLTHSGASSTKGQISLTDVRDDVVSLQPKACSVNSGTCYSTPWIVHPGDEHPRYVSFNVPVGTPNPNQCGRAVLSDVHLSGTSNSATFPNECASTDPDYAANEKALEFLFFDLASCVQNDSKPPVQPN